MSFDFVNLPSAHIEIVPSAVTRLALSFRVTKLPSVRTIGCKKFSATLQHVTLSTEAFGVVLSLRMRTLSDCIPFSISLLQSLCNFLVSLVVYLISECVLFIKSIFHNAPCNSFSIYLKIKAWLVGISLLSNHLILISILTFL